MPQRLQRYVLVLVLASATALLGAHAASAQRLSPDAIHGANWYASLHGRNAYPAIRGSTSLLEDRYHRTITVKLRHARRLSGRLLTVYVGGRLAGKMRVGSLGRAHLRHDTNLGQRVPKVRMGHYRVAVRNAHGVLVASGRLRLLNAS